MEKGIQLIYLKAPKEEFVPLSDVACNSNTWSLVNADIVGGIVPERKIGGRMSERCGG